MPGEAPGGDGHVCAACALDHHRWGPPTFEMFRPPPGYWVRLYRWECLCRACRPVCDAEQTRIEPDVSEGIPVDPVTMIIRRFLPPDVALMVRVLRGLERL